MSFGKMNSFIQLKTITAVTDEDGYDTIEEVTLASVKAYREERHASKYWANRALYTEATNLFCFRRIPGVTITTATLLFCENRRFEIMSVEDVKGRGMYIEVLAREKKIGS